MSVTISFGGENQKDCVEKMQEFLRTYHGADGVKKGTGPTDDPAEEKPAPKTRTRRKPAAKKEPEPEEEPKDPDEKYEKPKTKRGDKIEFEDITEAAGRLVKACQNDMKRAQELVYSEFGVRKVSKLAVEDYPKAHRWMLKIAEQMEDKAAEKAADKDEDDGE